jgi:molybdate transport system regulatory protein
LRYSRTMKQNLTATIKADFGNGLRLGAGKIRVLELVGETGSISAAARAMDMSYRKAWLLIHEMNLMFDAPVIATAAGGPGGGGAKLTDHGRKLIDAFQSLQREADVLVQTKLATFTR